MISVLLLCQLVDNILLVSRKSEQQVHFIAYIQGQVLYEFLNVFVSLSTDQSSEIECPRPIKALHFSGTRKTLFVSPVCLLKQSLFYWKHQCYIRSEAFVQ